MTASWYLGAALVGTVAAAWLGVLRSRRRWRALAQLVRQVEQGRLAVRAQAAGRDGLGRFAAIFNGMLVALQTRESQVVAVRDDLSLARERLQVTLRSIGEAVITTDAAGAVTFLNPIAQALTGWSESDAIGRALASVFDVIDDRTRESLTDRCLALIGPDPCAPLPFEATLLARDHRRRLVVTCTAAPIAHAAGVAGLVIVFQDVTEMRALHERLAWQASHDPLTGLCNRFAAEQAIAAAVSAARSGGADSALLYFDLDQFKVINDTCGHAAGDELLRELSQLLLGFHRGGDLLARMGGDEFTLLMRDADVEAAKSSAAGMSEAIRDFGFPWQDRVNQVSASIGVVTIDAGTADVAEVLRKADMACFVAKEAGRNRIHVYQNDDTALSRKHGEMQWVLRITQAVDDDRFLLLFQPIVRTVPGNHSSLHFEVLLRMLDEQGDLVVPGLFIPAAERYGLMQSIDRWVLRRVLRWFGQSGQRIATVETCAINLSGQSLGDAGFADFVLQELQSSGVPGDRLCFEITETAAIANIGHAQAFITRLKAHGCRFSLDDFGSGMSSFGYPKKLSVDYLKIDGSFVRNMGADPVSRAIIAAVSSLGRVMGIETIAESVENELILAELRDCGITYAQGYQVGRPAPLDSLMPPAPAPGSEGGLPPAAIEASTRAAVPTRMAR